MEIYTRGRLYRHVWRILIRGDGGPPLREQEHSGHPDYS